MKTEKCILGKLLDGEYRAIVYSNSRNIHTRSVVDFTDKTLLEIIYFLECFFGVEKETIEMI